MKFTKKNGGFTLVELIVVIAILAILAAIAVPAYSGYISKANEAADQQLLAAVNTAFAAACLENGEDAISLEDGSVIFDKNTMLVTSPAKYVEAFKRYFAANANAGSTFKTFSGLYFKSGVFVEGTLLTYTDATTGKVYTYSADANKAQALAGSTFMNEMGIGTTLDIMDMVSDFASGFQGASMQQVISGTDFMKSYVDYLGIDYEVTDETDPNTFYTALANDYGVTDAMTANAIVLYAADQSATLTTDSVKTLLGTKGVNAKDTILDTLSSDPSTAMAQTAAAYSMYTAYLYSLDDNYTNDDGETKAELIEAAKNKPMTVLDGLEDTGFQDYINKSSDADINGYLSAMGMLSEAAQTGNGANGTVSQDILNEGFSTEWMEAILGQVTNN